MKVGDLVKWRIDTRPADTRWWKVFVIIYADDTFVRVDGEPGLIGRGNFRVVSHVESR